MVPIEPEIARLSTIPANQFDREFLVSAIMDQQNAVQLCDDALARARDPSARAMVMQIRNKLGSDVLMLQRLAAMAS